MAAAQRSDDKFLVSHPQASVLPVPSDKEVCLLCPEDFIERTGGLRCLVLSWTGHHRDKGHVEDFLLWDRLAWKGSAHGTVGLNTSPLPQACCHHNTGGSGQLAP